MTGVYEKKYAVKHAKKYRKLPIGAVMVYLLAACLLTAGVSLARYITNVTGGDSARAARFTVTATGTQGQYLELDVNDPEKMTGRYPFTVTNRDETGISEVAIEYDVTVTLFGTSFFPDGLIMTLNCNGNIMERSVQAEVNGKTTYTFPNAGSFAAGTEATHSCYLQFTTTDSLTESVNLAGITVDITARQTD